MDFVYKKVVDTLMRDPPWPNIHIIWINLDNHIVLARGRCGWQMDTPIATRQLARPPHILFTYEPSAGYYVGTPCRVRE